MNDPIENMILVSKILATGNVNNKIVTDVVSMAYNRTKIGELNNIAALQRSRYEYLMSACRSSGYNVQEEIALRSECSIMEEDYKRQISRHMCMFYVDVLSLCNELQKMTAI